MTKPSCETLQKKVARLEKELARLRSSQRRNEEEYRALVENVNSIILRMDTEGRIIFFNEYALKFFGYSNDEIIGRNVVGTIVPESESTGRDLAGIIRDICRNTDRYAVNENENMKKDGSRVWVSWTNRAVFDATGSMAEILCVGNDITEHKKIEEDLRDSEKRFRTIFESAIDSIIIHDPRTGEIIDANTVAIKSYGYETLDDLKKNSFWGDPPFSFDDAVRWIHKAAAEGPQNFEWNSRNVGGGIFWEDVSLKKISIGVVDYIMAISRDITWRKQAEEKLRESEQKFRLLTENARDVIWLTDLNLNPVYVSQSIMRLCGYTPEEMIGRKLEEMLGPHSLELSIQLNAENADIEKTGTGDPDRTLTLELEFNRKDGSTVWTESIVTCQRELNGRPVAIVGVTRDISERRLAQAENETISRISQLFLSPGSMPDVYEGIPSILAMQFNYPITGIVKYDSMTDEIVYLGSAGIPWEGAGQPRYPASKTMAGTVIKTGIAIVELDVSGRPDYTTPALRALDVKTFICEPIFLCGTVFGALLIGDSRIRTEAPRIARTIRIIADYLSREILRRQMEETLKESEELTRNLMASVNEGIVIFNRNFSILLWNRFMEELTGVSACEVVGKTYTDYFPHIKNKQVFKDIKRSLEGETFRSEDMEFEFTRSGRKGWLIGQYMPLINEQDDIIGIIVSIRDITRRKMAEKSLGKTQEDLRETLEATTDGIWTWHARENEYYYSPRFYTMLGYEPGEFSATFASFKILIHPDDLERAVAIIRNYMSSGQGDIYENEFRLKTKNGEYRWIYAKARVVERDQEGRAVRLIGNHEDITERKTVEERLKWQLAVNMALAGLSGSIISQSHTIGDIAIIVLEYAKLLTESGEGYVSEIARDTGDNVILSSTIKMEDGHPAGVKENSADQPRDNNQKYEGLWGYTLNTKQAFFTNSPKEHESWAEPPHGHVRVERFLSVPVLFYSELVGQIAVANAPRDYNENDLVTVRRLGSLFAMAINRIRSEDRLRESLHEKEVLIKELHHRVKNNMQVVSSLLGLQSRKIDDEKYRKYFEECQNRIHAMAMVHEKLYHSEDMARVDFSEYIKELTRHLFFSYNVNRQTVHLNLDVREIFLGIDSAIPCAMIINELVSNALKHAFPAGRAGELSVSLVKNAEGKHVLNVSDNGIGVPEGFDIGNTNSLGMQIVQSLTRQIKGTFDFNGQDGTHIVILF